MGLIVLTRAGGWTDRLRRYDVWIDGQPHGSIAANTTERFEVAAGRHQIQLRIGLLYSSSIVTVEVGPTELTLTCRPRAIPGLAFLALARPVSWIILEPTAT